MDLTPPPRGTLSLGMIVHINGFLLGNIPLHCQVLRQPPLVGPIISPILQMGHAKVPSKRLESEITSITTEGHAPRWQSQYSKPGNLAPKLTLLTPAPAVISRCLRRCGKLQRRGV